MFLKKFHLNLLLLTNLIKDCNEHGKMWKSFNYSLYTRHSEICKLRAVLMYPQLVCLRLEVCFPPNIRFK